MKKAQEFSQAFQAPAEVVQLTLVEGAADEAIQVRPGNGLQQQTQAEVRPAAQEPGESGQARGQPQYRSPEIVVIFLDQARVRRRGGRIGAIEFPTAAAPLPLKVKRQTSREDGSVSRATSPVKGGAPAGASSRPRARARGACGANLVTGAPAPAGGPPPGSNPGRR